MFGSLTLLGLVAISSLVALLRDRGSLEHLLMREDAFMLTLAADVEQTGEHVRDASLMRSVVRRSVWPYLVVPYGIVYPVAFIMVLMGVAVPIIATVTALILGLYGAFPGIELNSLGYGELSEEWQPGQVKWWTLGVLSKIVLTAVALTLIFSATVSLNIEFTWWAIVTMMAGFIVMMNSHKPSQFMIRRSRQLAPSAFALDADSETILLLRSFGDDELLMRAPSAAAAVSAPALPMSRVRFEEVVAFLLRPFGRLVAIGRPGEGLPELGALRTYWSDDQWQDAIRATVMRCRAIVVIAGASDGLKWELERLRKWKVLDKCLVVLPPDADVERSRLRFSKAIELLTGEIVKSDEYHPAAWLGLHISHDGILTHHISNGRDWKAYVPMLIGFFAEFTGAVDTLEHGRFARTVERIEGIVEQSSTLEEGLSKLRESGEVAPASRTRTAYRTAGQERVMPSKVLRLVRLHDEIVEAVEEERWGDAHQSFLAMLEVIDRGKTPGLYSLVQAFTAEILASAGASREAVALAAEAEALAATCQRRINWLGSGFTPPEVRCRAIEIQLNVAEDATDCEAVVTLAERLYGAADDAADREKMCEARLRAARVLIRAGREESAEVPLMNARDLAVSLGDTRSENEASWLLHDLYVVSGRPEAALSMMKRCAELSELRDEPRRSVMARVLMSRTLRAIDRPLLCVSWMSKAVDGLENLKDPEERELCVAECIKELSRLTSLGAEGAEELRERVSR